MGSLGTDRIGGENGRPEKARPQFGHPVRRLNADVAGLFLLSTILSAGFGGLVVLPHVQNEIARDSRLTASDRRHAAGDQLRLDAAQFDVFRAQLRPKQRYSVAVRGKSKSRFINASTVRAYGAFYFLPAIQEPGARPVFRYHFK